MRRPSIDSILADPIVQQKQASYDRKLRRGSGQRHDSHDSGASGGSEGDRSAREQLQARMKQLDIKEKELESMSKIVVLTAYLLIE